VFEVMLASVFTAAFGSSGGPEVGLFNRSQKHWSNFNLDNFVCGSDALFSSQELITLRSEMLAYYTEAIKTQQPRDDYLELLNLCRIFLGGTTDIHYMAPGATHDVRWLSKAIYCLKI
jgi:hypothetical protein